MFIQLLCYPQVFRADKYVMYFERNNVALWNFSGSEKGERELCENMWNIPQQPEKQRRGQGLAREMENDKDTATVFWFYQLLVENLCFAWVTTLKKCPNIGQTGILRTEDWKEHNKVA